MGYEVECSTSCIDFVEQNQTVKIYTYLVVREDHHALFGFSSLEEKALFKILIKVSGVGPKMALSIVSSMTINDIIESVQLKNVHSFLRCKGVGRKLAEKIIIDCQNKMPELYVSQKSNALQDAELALINLGYKKSLISPICKEAFDSGIKDTADLIKHALGALQPS